MLRMSWLLNMAPMRRLATILILALSWQREVNLSAVFAFSSSLFQERCHRRSLETRSCLMTASNSIAASSSEVQWIVYIDQSPKALEKGGGETLDAFVCLAPTTVSIKPVILSKVSKSKQPFIRCIPTEINNGSTPLDIANVNSVEKVYRSLSKHMKVKVYSS